MRIYNIYLLYTGAECVARCAYTARFLTSMCTVIREKDDSEKILRYRIKMNKKKKKLKNLYRVGMSINSVVM